MNTHNIVDELIRLDCTTPPKRIAVIGDIINDVYVHGKLEATCQEDCPKFIEESRVVVPGGAANAENSLKHWFALRMLLPYSVMCPIKTRFMIDDKCVFRHDDDKVYDPSYLDIDREESMSALERWKPDAVLISDYDKGFLTTKYIGQIIEFCNRRKIPCVADAKRKPEVYAGAIIKANLQWYEKYGYTGTETVPHVLTCGMNCPVVNGSSEGIWGNRQQPHVKCINHVGAGDCFAAHLTLALAYGFSLKDAAAIAYSAGRVYVQRPHNCPPHPGLIRADFAVV